MTVLALAVTGRGLVDPIEPVIRADDEGAPARPRGVRDAPRLRRPSVSASKRISTG